MTPRNLFNFVLKIFGLLFLKEIILITPELIASLIYFKKSEPVEGGLFTVVASILMFLSCGFVIFLLFFRTNSIVDKLKLDKGFNQEQFSLNISSSLALTIVLLVIAGLILTNEIPNLCRQLFYYFHIKNLTHGMTKPDFSYVVNSGVKIIIAFLLIGERNRIVELLNRMKRNENNDATD